MGLNLTQLNLESAIFNEQKLLEVVSNFNTRCAKLLKEKARTKQIYTPKTGRLYRKGPNRFHRASARGEYPAPDTMNLVNSLKDEKQSQTQHTVYQDDSQADYGKYLVGDRLGRQIIPFSDVQSFSANEMATERQRLMEKLKEK